MAGMRKAITAMLSLATCAAFLSTGWSGFVQAICTNALAVTNVGSQALIGGRSPISDYCLMALDPQSTFHLTRQRALYLWRRDGVEAAIPILQAAVDRGATDLLLLTYLGLARIEADQLAAAVDTLSRVPNAGRLLDNLGQRQLACEEWDEAIKTYQVATQVDPALAAAWKGLGRAHRGRGDIQNAALAYQKAVTIASDDPDSYYGLGEALYLLGDYYAAINAYRNAIRLEPRRAHYHFGLGAAYLQLSDYRAAASAFEMAVSLKPRNKWCLYHYGWALENLSRFCDAAYQYQCALEVDPTYQLPADRLSALGAMGVLDDCARRPPTANCE